MSGDGMPGDRVTGDGRPGDGRPGPDEAGPDDAGTGPGAAPPAAPGGWEVPWPEPPGGGAGPPEREQLTTAFAGAVRRTGSLMQLVSQAAADRIGINATDLNCLNILSFSGHMTAGELARATGLTTASITGVADRLEQAGLVRRERDPADRRRVVIRLALDHVLGEVAPVFLPMIQALQRLAARYSDDELQLFVQFYGRMEQVFRDHLARLREASPGQVTEQ